MNTRAFSVRAPSPRLPFLLLGASAWILSACSGDGTTSGTSAVRVLIEPEDVIVDGISAGDSPEDVADGWNVTFDKYVVALGNVGLRLPSKDLEADDSTLWAVDLLRVASQGEPLWQLDDIAEGRWDFFYSTGIDGAERHDTVEQADFDAMVDADWTYLVEGTLQKADGVSCPPTALADVSADAVVAGENAGGDTCYENPSIRFAFGAEAETVYGPCEIDGLPGVSTASESTATVAISLHGDHLFFNGFPEGDEGGVMRLAQWWADVDLNLDGEVTAAELKAVSPAMLPELDERYQLGGSPISPLNDMYTYVRAQLKTQGHFEGEGECPIDGVEHDHAHDDHDHDHDHDHGAGGATN